jgi:hypothetical protein
MILLPYVQHICTCINDSSCIHSKTLNLLPNFAIDSASIPCQSCFVHYILHVSRRHELRLAHVSTPEHVGREQMLGFRDKLNGPDECSSPNKVVSNKRSRVMSGADLQTPPVRPFLSYPVVSGLVVLK